MLKATSKAKKYLFAVYLDNQCKNGRRSYGFGNGTGEGKTNFNNTA
jgi:uncharacterized protein (DUF169 family)